MQYVAITGAKQMLWYVTDNVGDDADDDADDDASKDLGPRVVHRSLGPGHDKTSPLCGSRVANGSFSDTWEWVTCKRCLAKQENGVTMR